MNTNVGAMTLFVADKERAKAFYANAFQAKQIHEDEHSVVFQFENMMIVLLDESQAPELIEPAPVGSGIRAQYTIWFDSCDAATEELRGRGVEFLNGPQDRAWGQRTSVFSDPDGHTWEIAQWLKAGS
jgi:catechol 2,3-dioxygenase-like lactoylglutathione lyase family enzyme